MATVDPMMKFEQTLEKRRELVRAALVSQEARREAEDVAALRGQEYAQTIADAVKGGVLEADLRAMGLEVVEGPVKRKRSRSQKSVGAQPAPVEGAPVE